MQDVINQWKRLSDEASECALIASSETDMRKRDLFARLAKQYGEMVEEVARFIRESRLPG